MSLSVNPPVPAPEPLNPPGHWNWHLPVHMSQGWACGELVIVGGQIALDTEGDVIGVGNIEVQTRVVFENIGRILEQAGAGWEHLVKLNTYYVCDGSREDAVEFWEKMTRVRMEFLQEPGPAATAVRVVGLMYPELLVEAEAIAVLPTRA